MAGLDRRRHAWREDLADERLRGRIMAQRFITGTRKRITRPVLPLHREPSPHSMQLTQALLGETALLFEEHNGWGWLQLEGDGYVGFAQLDGLAEIRQAPTHRLSVPLSFIFPEPDIKSSPVTPLALNSHFTAVGEEGSFLKRDEGGYVYSAHSREVDIYAGDFVDEALRFIHAPYLWGGKSVLGIDCSGLVQLSLQACGYDCPRDSDMQQAELGIAFTGTALRRGDLIFWDGHVGLMIDEELLLHANGYHLQVVQEPLSQAAARIGAKGSNITAVRRLSVTT